MDYINTSFFHKPIALAILSAFLHSTNTFAVDSLDLSSSFIDDSNPINISGANYFINSTPTNGNLGGINKNIIFTSDGSSLQISLEHNATFNDNIHIGSIESGNYNSTLELLTVPLTSDRYDFSVNKKIDAKNLTINFAGNNESQLWLHESVTLGAVTTSVDGVGEFVIASKNDAVIYHDVGSKYNSLAAFLSMEDTGNIAIALHGNIYSKILGFNESSVSFKGSLTSEQIQLGESAKFTFDGAAEQRVFGNITSFGNNSIDIINTAGKVTFENKIVVNSHVPTSILSMNVAPASHVQFNSANNKISTLTLADSSKITLGDAIGKDTIFNTGKIIVGTNSTDRAKLYVSAALNAGETITLTTDDTGASRVAGDQNAVSLTNGQLQLQDTALYDYGFKLVDGKVLITISEKSTVDSIEELKVSKQVVVAAKQANAAIQALSDTSLRDSLQAKLDAALNKDSTSAKNVALELAVQTDMLSSTPTAAVQTSSTIFDVTSMRLSTMRTGSQFSGISTGDKELDKGLWLRSFLSKNDLDTIQDSYGYAAATYGFVLGFDNKLVNDFRLGSAFTYAQTNIEGDGVGAFKNNVDTYQLTFYGDYTRDDYYLEGMLGYALSKNDVEHQVLTSKVTADYDSHQWMARVTGGMPFKISSNLLLNPNFSLSYTHVVTDNYAENGVLAKYIAIDNIDSLKGSLDTKLYHQFKTEQGILKSSVHAGVNYEFADTNITSNNHFLGQTTNIAAASTDIDRASAEFGLGFEYKTDVWSFIGEYNGSVNNDAMSNTFSLQLRYEF